MGLGAGAVLALFLTVRNAPEPPHKAPVVKTVTPPEPPPPDPKADALERGRIFNLASKGPDGWPADVRDPNTYNPLDEILVSKMLTELTTLKIVRMVQHPDGQRALSAKHALMETVENHIEALKQAMARRAWPTSWTA